MDEFDDVTPDDAHYEYLAEFDEALRLGKPVESQPSADSTLQETEDFLVFLNSAWERKSKRIGPYTLIRNLGSGSLGPSYLVEDPQSNRIHVLRMLWPDLNKHASLRKQVLMEANAVRLLRHPNVLSMRRVHLAGSAAMLLSSYHDGPSLAEWRHVHSAPIAWEVAVAFVANLADILEQAHAQGFTHGNLKHSNIFLPNGPDVTLANLHRAPAMIGEFGLAKPLLQCGSMMQSHLPWPMPQYLAPEQLARRGAPADLASDLYALGVLLYELCTCVSPVQGTTREEIVRQTRERIPTPPRQMCRDLPEDVNDLIMKCLMKRSDQRHGSAKLLAEACRLSLPGAVQPKATPSWWRRWLRWQ